MHTRTHDCQATPEPEPGSESNPAKRAPGESTHEAILAAARRLVAKSPEVSIQAVAAEAGVSRQTVHAHFGGARGLRAALAAEGLLPADPLDETSTRERLIDAAERLLSRPGGGFISIEAIAAEAGMTKGAVYHHFADRGEVLRAVARRVSPVDEMKARIMPSIELSAARRPDRHRPRLLRRDARSGGSHPQSRRQFGP